MVKAIVFDCWNTLFRNQCDPHPFHVFAEKIGYDFNDYGFMKRFERHNMLEKHARLEVPIKSLLAELHVKASKDFVKELVKVLETGVNDFEAYPDAIPTLIELKKKYSLGLITNTSYTAFSRVEKEFHLSKYFKVILKSYETKILKPEARIFKMMVDRLGVEKSEVLMVGDSLADDVLAAEKFGVRSLLIDRRNKHSDYKNRITSLKQLQKILR